MGDAAATIINELLDDELISRLSFPNFAAKIRKYSVDHGKAELVLTWQPAIGAPCESIDVDELASPRTGIYRCRLKFAPQKFIEAHHTTATDLTPRDARQTIDMGWQNLADYQMVHVARSEQALTKMEERWQSEHLARMAAEERALRAERRVAELEEALDEQKPIFDDSIIELFQGLFTDTIGMEELRGQAEIIIDQCSEFVDGNEKPTELGQLLLEKAPHVLTLLARMTGADGTDEDQ